jgi:hypothetical protein
LYLVSFAPNINPLPVQFKSLLPGQEGCIFFSGHLNPRTCHYVLLRWGRQAAFQFTTFYYVKAGKGLSCVQTQSHMSSHGFLCSHLDRLNLRPWFTSAEPLCSIFSFVLKTSEKNYLLSEAYIQQLYVIVLKCAIPCSVQLKKLPYFVGQFQCHVVAFHCISAMS